MTIIVIFCLTLAACPPAVKKPPVKKPPKEITRPEAPAEAATPQRKASARLIDKGKAYLDTRNYDQAALIFQDAVNVDPSNGVAYYYLALTDHYLGEQGIAAGLLDKAESLLSHDEYWMDKIEELRYLITGEKVAPLPPVVDQYY